MTTFSNFDLYQLTFGSKPNVADIKSESGVMSHSSARKGQLALLSRNGVESAFWQLGAYRVIAVICGFLSRVYCWRLRLDAIQRSGGEPASGI